MHHRELDSWKLARKMVQEVYKMTREFPSDERFGLTSQVRRSAISIPSNIAEGAARRTPEHYLRFLYDARGSLSELHTQLLLAGDLGYLTSGSDDLFQDVDRLQSVLQGQINALESKCDR